MTRGSRGFTLIELLVVVAIIGIIAVIAIPNLLYAMDKTKRTKTMADLERLGKAIETYAIENNDFPTATDISELAGVLAPKYLREVPQRDGWSNTFTVVSTPDAYTVCSNGKDGAGTCERDAEHSEPDDFDASITYTLGAFVAKPRGNQ